MMLDTKHAPQMTTSGDDVQPIDASASFVEASISLQLKHKSLEVVTHRGSAILMTANVKCKSVPQCRTRQILIG